MNQDLCAEFAIRTAIMDLLTEAEVSRLCAGMGLSRLREGDEYLDLLRLDLEVQRVTGMDMPCGSVIARSAVHAQVWSEILEQLSRAPELSSPHTGRASTCSSAGRSRARPERAAASRDLCAPDCLGRACQ